MSQENLNIPEEAIHVPEGQEVPEGYVPLSDLMGGKLKDVIAERRRQLLKDNGVNILGVPADEAKQLAKDLLELAPEQITRLVAAASWLMLNQSDVVDRIGLAVQDSLVFMNNHAGQLNVRNYVLTEKPTKLTNMRMDFKGRTGDLATEENNVYGFSYRIYVPLNQKEFDAGPDSYSQVMAFNRTTHYHLTHQLVGLEANEPRSYYLTYSTDMQDPFLAPTRAIEEANPEINKEVTGDLKVNINVN
jgi:hypothetical protein